MKVNGDKCHPLVTSNYKASATVNEFEMESSKKEKLLGLLIDTRLFLEQHITYICKKASQFLVLARIKHCMDFKKRRFLMKAFVISQFNYYPLI